MVAKKSKSKKEMKGVILAGGTGTRLLPLTKVTNKHLLPVYDKPMIYYPLNTLIQAGITDIMIVSGRGHAGHFLELLGSGKDFGVKLSYAIQEKAGGIAEALGLARDFVDGDNICVILGDNVFEDVIDIRDFKAGAMIYIKHVPDPKRFGVVTLKGDKVVRVVEKPKVPETDWAVTGLYVYDSNVFEMISKLKPSGRGELEITDVNNAYIRSGKMEARRVKGFWTDAGTFESLYRATTLVRDKKKE